ncbi:diacylglycerol kinase family lipid kinase [Clostridium sp. YIM B02515]|uniref:Diacylglycerol kinase family lipid kinase n=1 Tax=Clostridium rhizosphaerae TaxID=2803861 RepID=A0ABS1TBM3_9CLOT|nr:diacylglycerol kinase family protein [Clostridium rhizosphaerae]MBL4936671.1 diacylglycerol kinase family lipid kinase [Clostridium rhizosphaerae]
MNHLFIINPAAGKGKTLKLIPVIEKIFEHRNEKYVIEVTKGVGHATELVRKYSSTEDFRIYSVGGDGTLNEVLNGMVNTNSSLAVIPSGSGNDFIKSIYNYSKKEKIEDIFLKMIDGKEKYIDLGIVNNRYFLNIASAGFDAEVAYNAIKLKKMPFIGGKLAYILGIIITVFKYKSPDLQIIIDNRKFNMKALLVAVANGRYYGGGINVTPEAKIDDGIFNVCNIEEVSKPRILVLFPKVIKGTHSKIKEVHFQNGKKIKLVSPKIISFNIDGEISRGKEVEFSMIENGIKIVCP